MMFGKDLVKCKLIFKEYLNNLNELMNNIKLWWFCLVWDEFFWFNFMWCMVMWVILLLCLCFSVLVLRWFLYLLWFILIILDIKVMVDDYL